MNAARSRRSTTTVVAARRKLARSALPIVCGSCSVGAPGRARKALPAKGGRRQGSRRGRVRKASGGGAPGRGFKHPAEVFSTNLRRGLFRRRANACETQGRLSRRTRVSSQWPILRLTGAEPRRRPMSPTRCVPFLAPDGVRFRGVVYAERHRYQTVRCALRSSERPGGQRGRPCTGGPSARGAW